MRIYLKTHEQIERIRKAGRIAARVLRTCAEMIEPNRTLDVELDQLAEQMVLEMGGFPAFMGYRLFPSALCVSINEEVVHGLPTGRVLRAGDIETLDIGVYYEGYCCDMAITRIVGHADYQRKRLVRVTEEALHKALEVTRAGNTTGDISAAIQQHAEAFGFKPARGWQGTASGDSSTRCPTSPTSAKRAQA